MSKSASRVIAVREISGIRQLLLKLSLAVAWNTFLQDSVEQTGTQNIYVVYFVQKLLPRHCRHTHRHTQQIDFSIWSTKVVDKNGCNRRTKLVTWYIRLPATKARNRRLLSSPSHRHHWLLLLLLLRAGADVYGISLAYCRVAGTAARIKQHDSLPASLLHCLNWC